MTTPAVAALILQIEAALRPLADALQAVPVRVYMLDQFAFLGIRATPRRQALRGLPRLKTWTGPELLVLAEALWDLPEREFHYVAVDLLAKHHRQLDLDRLPPALPLLGAARPAPCRQLFSVFRGGAARGPRLRAYRGTDIPVLFEFQQESDRGLGNARRQLFSVRLSILILNAHGRPANCHLARILDASS